MRPRMGKVMLNPSFFREEFLNYITIFCYQKNTVCSFIPFPPIIFPSPLVLMQCEVGGSHSQGFHAVIVKVELPGEKHIYSLSRPK